MNDFVAWALFVAFWLAGTLNLVAAYYSQGSDFFRFQFLGLSLAMFSGAAFYTLVAIVQPTPIDEVVTQTQILSRMVWGAVAIINCTVPSAWLIRVSKYA